MNLIADKVATLWPEIALAIGATLCLFTGLSPLAAVRKSTAWIAAIALFVAGLLIPLMPLPEHVIGLGGIVPYVKMAVVLVGLILLLVAANLPGQLRQVRDGEAAVTFEPGNVFRGEFFAFFLFSLIGVMLTAGADELVWLFLALELTSLPTYVMVAVSRDRVDAQESAVKYFFLGALSAAIFLYGFALIYGATGFTDFAGIAAVAQQQIADNGQISELFLIGIVLAIVGICFKIAAVPMHFYAADVYEGASTAVTAFLAFVPKTAGFVALILVLGLIGWHPLPTSIVYLLWAIAALTMTIGNVLGLVQNNVKRVLAYSSIAHSGYILVGLLAGTALTTEVLDDGIAAVLFYLVAYGLGTIAGFAVLGSLTARGEEAQTFDDLAGLSKRSPFLAALMAISMLSLLGLPPLVGFVGKIYLFGSALKAGYLWLVIIAVINSAISAGYYLRIAAVCYFGEPSKAVSLLPVPSRRLGAAIAAIAAVFLGIAGGSLVQSARQASTRPLPASVSDTPAQPISAQGLLQAPAAASEHPL